MKFRLIIGRRDATGVLGQDVEFEEFNPEGFKLNCLKKAGEVTRGISGWNADVTELSIDYDTMDPETYQKVLDYVFTVKPKYKIELYKVKPNERMYIAKSLEDLAAITIEDIKMLTDSRIAKEINIALFEAHRNDEREIKDIARVEIYDAEDKSRIIYVLKIAEMEKDPAIKRLLTPDKEGKDGR